MDVASSMLVLGMKSWTGTQTQTKTGAYIGLIPNFSNLGPSGI